MRQVKDGQLKVLEVLYDRYQMKLYNFFLKLCRDPMASEDLLQNVFMRIMKYRSSYNPEYPFKTWVYQLARHLFYDHYQQQMRTRDQFASVDQVEASDTIDNDLEQQEEQQQLEEALQRLPLEKRELLVMSKIQGMHYEDIAAIKDITISNVKVQVHRAMKDLRSAYFNIN